MERQALASVALSALSLCGAVACKRAERNDVRRPVADGGADLSTASVLARSTRARAAAPLASCRAIAVEGEVVARDTGGGAAATAVRLAGQAEVVGDSWIELGPNARLGIKDPRTARETLFRGPAECRVCVGHQEESWVRHGGFESQRGAGETPGAEEWVVTPDAVVRYGAASLRIEVRAPTTTLGVAGGTAFVWVASDARFEGAVRDGGGNDPWARVSVESVRVIGPPKGTRNNADAAQASTLYCADLARGAAAKTRALLAPAAPSVDHDGAAAGRVIEQVTTRRVARAACAVAGLRLSTLDASDAKAALSRALHEAEDAFTALPVVPPLLGAPPAAEPAR